MNRIATYVGGGVCLAVLAGCAAQVDSHYRGEPLAVLQGAVVAQEVPLGDHVAPMLGWYGFGLPDEDKRQESPSILQEAEVTGAFPNQFSLRLYEPPPAEAMLEDEDGLQIAIAYIFAVRTDRDWSVGWDRSDGDKPDWYAGGAANYMVMYLSQALTPGSKGARLFGDTLAAGFHIVELSEWTPEENAQRQACDDPEQTGTLSEYNLEQGTDFEDEFALDDDQLDAFYAWQYEREFECLDAAGLQPGKVRMTARPIDGSYELALRMGRDIEYLDWN